MFQKPLAIKTAGVLGVASALVYLLVAFDFTAEINALDPYAEQD